MTTGYSAKCDNCGREHSNTNSDLQIMCYPGGMQIGLIESDGDLGSTLDICEECAELVEAALKRTKLPKGTVIYNLDQLQDVVDNTGFPCILREATKEELP